VSHLPPTPAPPPPPGYAPLPPRSASPPAAAPPPTPRRRRRWLLPAVALVAIALVAAAALTALGDGDGDGDDAAVGDAAAGTAAGPDLAGELAWQRDDLSAVVGVLGETVLVSADGFDPTALVDLTSGDELADLPETFGSVLWSDGELLLGRSNGTTAVDVATGAVVWSHELFAEDLPGSGVVVGHVFDDATPLDDIVALDLASGDELWRLEGTASDGPWIDDGLVVWSDDERVLHAVDARTGEDRWEVDGYQLEGHVTPLTRDGPPGSEPDDGVVLAYDAGDLVALDPGDGTERWRAGPWDADSFDVSPFGGVVVLTEGEDSANPTAYVGLDPATGDERWRVDTGDEYSFMFVLGPRHLAVVGDLSSTSDAATLAVVVADTGTVTEIELDSGVFDAAANDGAIAVVDQEGGLTAFAPDGASRWDAGDERFGAVTVVGSTVAARTVDGELVGFDAGSGAERWRVDVGTTDGFVAAAPSGVVGGSDDGSGFLVR
jgi:outer membrane protein assembly factor BamB